MERKIVGYRNGIETVEPWSNSMLLLSLRGVITQKNAVSVCNYSQKDYTYSVKKWCIWGLPHCLCQKIGD